MADLEITAVVCSGAGFDDRAVVWSALSEILATYRWIDRVAYMKSGISPVIEEWAVRQARLGLLEVSAAQKVRPGMSWEATQNNRLLDRAGADLLVLFPGDGVVGHMRKLAEKRFLPMLVVGKDGSWWAEGRGW